jgi:hypothetical protein
MEENRVSPAARVSRRLEIDTTMKYYIKRDLNEYGPYTLADLQRYVAQGNIAMTDLTRSEGMTDWVPVSQVIGNIPVPVTAPAPAAYAGATVYGGPTVYSGQSAYGTTPGVATSPVPPDFHWALVLLLGVVTCGLFLWAWIIVEAAFIRKIKPQSKGLLFLLLGFGCHIAAAVVNIAVAATTRGSQNPLGGLFSLAGLVLQIIAYFTMRSDLEDYYNSTENIGLSLSGVMTFFFAVFYFQHHFSRIAKWKKTGVLEPQ